MADPDARPAAEPGRFEEIYDEQVVPIYRFIYARVGNRPDAEDLTAQVFMRAVEQLDTTRDHGQIVSWLYRVSQNAIADYWRAFYRLPVIGADQVAPGWEPAQPDEARERPGEGLAATDRVRELLGRLPQRYAQVLELRFLERLSVAETASRMGISHGNAKILQYRALRKAALLGDADG
ncbi:MAG TPA: sigma-70 family RNA polymerase sigma factor [Candidatus Limnocylindria bacterium]|jgi:RNA polymerase sigma-70 factor (ECF subfamily)|nr:sigma-70 family RNA polymerase sigma factor [Candidatus Limnocylindria bacterium]